MKKQFRIFLFLFVCLAVFACLYVYSRGGGGGGTGGGGNSGSGRGNIIYPILWAIYTIITTFVLLFKSKKAKKIASSSPDDIWRIDNLEETAKNAFYNFQKAWMEKDLSSLSNFVTQRFYDEQNANLVNSLPGYKQNIIECIQIKSIKIIACRDYIDNSFDSFTANIKGSLIDYTINKKSKKILSGSSTEFEKFTDSYTFLRYNNQWLLDEVENDPMLGHFLNSKNYTEK